MYQLNNLDIIILFVIGISALIALSRGLVKEVLSIIGWVLGTIAVIYIFVFPQLFLQFYYSQFFEYYFLYVKYNLDLMFQNYFHHFYFFLHIFFLSH